MTSDPLYYEILKRYAIENRNNQTNAEESLWQCLSCNRLGLHFRRQHIVGCYIADFICLKAKTIIEIDGGYHSQEDQLIHDYWRTENLNRMGFDVLRYTNEQIMQDTSKVLDEIYNHIVQKIRHD